MKTISDQFYMFLKEFFEGNFNYNFELWHVIPALGGVFIIYSFRYKKWNGEVESTDHKYIGDAKTADEARIKVWRHAAKLGGETSEEKFDDGIQVTVSKKTSWWNTVFGSVNNDDVNWK